MRRLEMQASNSMKQTLAKIVGSRLELMDGPAEGEQDSMLPSHIGAGPHRIFLSENVETLDGSIRMQCTDTATIIADDFSLCMKQEYLEPKHSFV